ncbi:6-phosphofructo-2-kinase/fructose-2,6-bisphosphatase [Gossypium arboreum]|uniref:6-phosphofructo-2-kinase/fructose-2, 6-bisphosphatase n=1 Tax=Gossypium arboreum TaxID=29729 RepID=A0A0B0NNZ6_GOSAR|nr:6-phosphofructo-2-kinase/fructose-2,6-bisphosphatase [Gossypium arboreum]
MPVSSFNLPGNFFSCCSSDTGEIYMKKLANFVVKRLI